MAIFGAKKTTAKTSTKKEAKEVSAVVAQEGASATAVSISSGLDITKVLIRPHVTEKATDLADRGNVYAFEVHPSANKAQVKIAIEKLFKVTPVKIAIIRIHSKYMKSRKSNQVVLKKQGLKKALVTLKSGDKIEFV